jgi:large subunit ribosomal protein L53
MPTRLRRLRCISGLPSTVNLFDDHKRKSLTSRAQSSNGTTQLAENISASHRSIPLSVKHENSTPHPNPSSPSLTNHAQTYLTTVTTAFNSFSRTSKVPRLVLNSLPANAHKSIAIKTTLLPQSSRAPATLELGFKDGKKMVYAWPETPLKEGEKPASIEDVVYEVNRHARIQARQEELKG